MESLVSYLAIGAIAGLFSGLFGIGGGIIVVPLLHYMFKPLFPEAAITQLAVGTSLAIMMFTSLSSAFAYYRHQLISVAVFLKLIPGILLGTLIGTFITGHITSEILLQAFAFFLFFVGLNLLFPIKMIMRQTLPEWYFLIIITSMIGICSGLFGVGGGSLIVPLLVFCNIEIHRAAGTSALCGVPFSILGTLSMIYIGHTTIMCNQPPLPPGTTGFVYWPAALSVAITSMMFAPLGTKLSVWLSGNILKKMFGLVLIATGIKLIL